MSRKKRDQHPDAAAAQRSPAQERLSDVILDRVVFSDRRTCFYAANCKYFILDTLV